MFVSSRKGIRLKLRLASHAAAVRTLRGLLTRMTKCPCAMLILIMAISADGSRDAEHRAFHSCETKHSTVELNFCKFAMPARVALFNVEQST
jgi:hypothetical protein